MTPRQPIHGTLRWAPPSQAPPTYPDGRHCPCGIRLSVFNAGPDCYLCDSLGEQDCN